MLHKEQDHYPQWHTSLRSSGRLRYERSRTEGTGHLFLFSSCMVCRFAIGIYTAEANGSKSLFPLACLLSFLYSFFRFSLLYYWAGHLSSLCFLFLSPSVKAKSLGSPKQCASVRTNPGKRGVAHSCTHRLFSLSSSSSSFFLLPVALLHITWSIWRLLCVCVLVFDLLIAPQLWFDDWRCVCTFLILYVCSEFAYLISSSHLIR